MNQERKKENIRKSDNPNKGFEPLCLL